MTIYTRRGDAGETDLRGGDRVPKSDPRIEAYGSVDELNALLGVARTAADGELDGELADVQDDLHVIQAELASVEPVEPRIEAADVARLESIIDRYQAGLPDLESFILPGGGTLGARLHHARAVCRRAERRVAALADSDDESRPPAKYLNRLSDLLFVMARSANQGDGVPEESPTYGE